MGLILAIDAGTTNLKVGVLDERLRVLALSNTATKVITTPDGGAEHDPRDLWQAVAKAVREVTRDRAGEVRMIVLSAYQFGWMLLDEHRAPLTGISLLSDTRARASFGEFLREFDAEDLYTRTGCPALFQYPLARSFHFKRTQPELWRRARFFCGSKDWLLWRLTDEFVTEHSIAAATQLMGLGSCEWDEALLARIGIARDSLPRLVNGAEHTLALSAEAAGELGLPAGLPVLPGYYDGGALCAGIGALGGGVGVINTGTSAMLRAASARPALDASPHKRLQCYALGPGRYLNGGGVNNAGLAIQWFKTRVAEADIEGGDALALAEAAREVFAFPFLTGERDALLGQDASGMFVGLRLSHGARELLYATMESVAFSLLSIQEAMGAEAPECYRMAGGMTRSPLWCRLIASALRRPVVTMPESEGGLAGCAALGWARLGVSLPEDVFAPGKTHEPDERLSKLLGEKFAVRQSLQPALAAIYRTAARG